MDDEPRKIQRTKEGLPVVTEEVLYDFLDKSLVKARKGFNLQLTEWIRDTDSENRMVSCYIKASSIEFPKRYQNRVDFFLEGLYHLLKEQARKSASYESNEQLNLSLPKQ